MEGSKISDEHIRETLYPSQALVVKHVLLLEHH